jgi:drug/metabolite transporter (DMT)-like permease
VIRQHLGELYSLLCALLWAIAVLLFRKGGEKVPPVALNAFKGAVAIVCFLLTLLFVRVPLLPGEHAVPDLLVLLASGAVGIGIADSLFFASLNRLGASGAAVVDCVYSPFVVLLAFAYLGEPLRGTLLLAMALMVSAILIVTWEPVKVSSPEELRRRRQGVLLGVISMFLMAAGIVLAKPVLNRTPVLWATPVRLVGGEVLIFLQALRRSERAAVLRAFRPSRQWLITMPSALIGSYLAMIVWIAGMKYAQAGVAGVLSQTSTLFVPLLAAVFLKEKLSRAKLLAVLLGFGGALVATI